MPQVYTVLYCFASETGRLQRILEGGTLKYEKGMSVREYAQKNRGWLEKLAQSGNVVVRSMALAVLIVAESDNIE